MSETRRPQILIVDDSPLIRRVVTDHFESNGYRVVEAEDGAVALERIETFQPDLVVSDVLMPNMDGWRLFETLRARPETCDVPFVFLTVERDLPSRLRGLRSGADDYVTKPFEVEELHARVDRLLNGPRAAASRALEAEAILTGTVEHLSVSDLLQILSMNGKDCVVRMSGAGGEGEIVFCAGQLADAKAGRASGLKALYRMLAWQRARFRVEPLAAEPAERSIRGQTSSLVMDGLVAIDEWNRYKASLPAGETVLALSSNARNLIDVDRVRPEEFDVLSRSKRGSNVRRIFEESPLPDGQLARAICTLIERGVLTAGG